jgi:dihydrofolate reductase
MRRVRYSVACSLDGFIAGPKGEHDWITMDPSIDFAAFMAEFDTILLGRRTFQVAQGHGGGGGGMGGMKSIVFSRTLRAADHPKATIVNDAVPAVAELKAQPGKDIWLMGGGSLFRSLLDAHLVDSIEVGVMPVLLGAGIPLLPGPYSKCELTLASSKTLASGTLMLTYQPRAPRPKRRVRRGEDRE